jgi:hypothetical protein
MWCRVIYMNTATVIRVEDHEGTGTCGHCGREGLRWIAVMSDGSMIGTSCAKKLMGFNVTAKTVTDLKGFVVTAEWRNRFNDLYVLWYSTERDTYAETLANGKVRFGQVVAKQWQSDGWI